MKKQFIYIAILSFSLLACDKNEPNQNIVNYECVTNSLIESAEIDEEESAMIIECQNTAFTEKEDILSILNGTWELVGYGGGWVQASQYDCVVLSFEDNIMKRRTINDEEDKTTEYEWELEPYQYANDQGFNLKITEDSISYGLVNKFCQKYMYVNDTPVDGNLEIYGRVE